MGFNLNFDAIDFAADVTGLNVNYRLFAVFSLRKIYRVENFKLFDLLTALKTEQGI